MLPHAYVSHHSKGRIRIRIPAKQHDSDYFSDLQQRLESKEFIQKLDINVNTGSVLVLHTAQDHSAILNYGKQHALFDMPENPLGQSHVETNSLLIKSLIGLSAVQILRGEILAPASSLLTDACRLYLNKSGVAGSQRD